MHPWRERLARWFTPLAKRIPISPNAITIIALLLNIVAAGCLIAADRRPWLFLVAIVIIAVSGIADALDGIVARVQEKASRFGDFLDHCADRTSDTLLAAAWLISNGVREPLAMAGIIMTMLNGYIGTQIEATWKVREYDSIGRAEFVLALVVFPLVSHILAANGWRGIRGAGLTIPEWLSIAMALFAILGIAQRFAKAARMERS